MEAVIAEDDTFHVCQLMSTKDGPHWIVHCDANNRNICPGQTFAILSGESRSRQVAELLLCTRKATRQLAALKKYFATPVRDILDKNDLLNITKLSKAKQQALKKHQHLVDVFPMLDLIDKWQDAVFPLNGLLTRIYRSQRKPTTLFDTLRAFFRENVRLFSDYASLFAEYHSRVATYFIPESVFKTYETAFPEETAALFGRRVDVTVLLFAPLRFLSELVSTFEVGFAGLTRSPFVPT